jgi:hypothetical protein
VAPRLPEDCDSIVIVPAAACGIIAVGPSIAVFT